MCRRTWDYEVLWFTPYFLWPTPLTYRQKLKKTVGNPFAEWLKEDDDDAPFSLGFSLYLLSSFSLKRHDFLSPTGSLDVQSIVTQWSHRKCHFTTSAPSPGSESQSKGKRSGHTWVPSLSPTSSSQPSGIFSWFWEGRNTGACGGSIATASHEPSSTKSCSHAAVPCGAMHVWQNCQPRRFLPLLWSHWERHERWRATCAGSRAFPRGLSRITPCSAYCCRSIILDLNHMTLAQMCGVQKACWLRFGPLKLIIAHHIV